MHGLQKIIAMNKEAARVRPTCSVVPLLVGPGEFVVRLNHPKHGQLAVDLNDPGQHAIFDARCVAAGVEPSDVLFRYETIEPSRIDALVNSYHE